MAGSLFRTKSIDRLMADGAATGENALRRTLGPMALVALGIGAIIGAGLFVRTAAAYGMLQVVLIFVVMWFSGRLETGGRAASRQAEQWTN